ncbi:hypothetical protein FHS18_003761 [Paenibacillus phyllosphaerae]|uniref:SLH domain-containing protein n=1 Tax=Paenibacillus phyllosphaerae TaxID=274593 RepID=A0A7W5AZK8_9BACL|nr:S-layer homology domain-containing protein [Paenibacillus phyllosphaerae]MBB3111693.1 hypothetical protein [Paenibacillus phyllosphaerae]
MGANKGKQATAAALALVTAVTPLTAYAQETASIQQGHEQDSEQVLEAIARGLMSKDKQGNFHAERTLTRAEFAALLSRVFGLSVSAVATSSFKDVRPQSWAAPSIEAVTAKGWMKGSGNSFQPNEPVTREQAATVLVRALGLDLAAMAGAPTPDDLAEAGQWARESVQAAAAAALFPMTDGKFNPKASLVRGEAAAVFVTVSNQLPLTIEQVGEGTVTASGITYTAAAEVQGLFVADNQAALAGAKLSATMRNGVIESVEALELLSGGRSAAEGAAEFSGNAVLDGHGAIVAGTLIANADYITVNNLTVKGNFEVGAGLQHDFYSSGLKVEGETLIKGGDDNTVVFQNANLGSINVNKPGVRVAAGGNTTVGTIAVNSNATIEADTGITLPKMTVGEGAKDVNLDANVTDLNVASGNSNMTLGDKTKIANLTLPEGVDPSSVISNYSQFKDRIGNVNGTSNNTVVTNTTSTTTSVNKKTLETAISAAKDLADGIDELSAIGDDYGQYPSAAFDTFKQAINAAEAIYAQSSVKQSAVNSAVTTLNAAIEAFRNAKITTVSTKALASLIVEAQAAAEEETLSAGAKSALLAAIEAAQAVIDSKPEGAEGHAAVSIGLSQLQAALDALDAPAASKETIQAVIGEATAIVTALNPETDLGEDYGQYPSSALDNLNAAIAVAETTNGSMTATQSAVDNAAAALSSAFEAFQSAKITTVSTNALASLIVEAQAAAEEETLSAGAKSALLAAIESAQAVIDSKPEGAEGYAAVQSALGQLQAALESIDAPAASKETIQAVIGEAKAIVAALNSEADLGEDYGQYPVSALDSFNAAIAAAESTNASTTATQSAVDNAAAALKAAIEAFQSTKITTVSTNALAALITEAQAVAEEETLSAGAKFELQGAIESAQAVIDSKPEGAEGHTAVQSELSQLQAALDALDAPAASKETIQAVIGEATAIVSALNLETDIGEEDYGQFPVSALDSFNAAIAAAESTNASATATQSAVDNAAAELSSAIEAFQSTKITVVNTNALAALIAKAESIDLEYSGTQAIEDLTNAIVSAKEALNQDTLTGSEWQVAINQGKSGLQSALSNIETWKLMVDLVNVIQSYKAYIASTPDVYRELDANNFLAAIEAADDYLTSGDLNYAAISTHFGNLDSAYMYYQFSNTIYLAQAEYDRTELGEEVGDILYEADQAVFQNAIVTAVNVLSDPNSIPYDILMAQNALGTASNQFNQMKVGDKTSLAEQIQMAELTLTSNPDNTNAANLKAAIDAVKAVMDGPAATVSTIQQVSVNLSFALFQFSKAEGTNSGIPLIPSELVTYNEETDSFDPIMSE